MQNLNIFYEIDKQFSEIFESLEQIFSQEEKTAIGISGGSDSMFLAIIFITFRKIKNRDKKNLYFLHANHGIRKESREEEKTLKALFQEWHFQSFLNPSPEHKKEEQLRKRRYQEFSLFCQQHQIKKLALGHNLSDRIESSLMHMIRGCGLKGFLNMQLSSSHPLLKNVDVVRPLIHLSKTKIEEICKNFNVPFFTDKSNTDPNTSFRNLVRHQFLLPLEAYSLGRDKEESSFFMSWDRVYCELEQQRPQNSWLIPLKKCPYWNAKKAYERMLPSFQNLKITDLTTCFHQLGLVISQGTLSSLLDRLKEGKDGFRRIATWTLFFSHQRCYFIEGKEFFWESFINKEKKIIQSGLQQFGLYQIDIPKEFIGGTLKFPQLGTKFKGKGYGKRALNKKIPIFWRNYLPLVEKEEKTIKIFVPEELIF